MVAITIFIAYNITKITKFRFVQQDISNEIGATGKTINEAGSNLSTPLNLITKKEHTTSFDKKELLLFVTIISAPYQEDRRTAGRETWIKECNINAQMLFVNILQMVEIL